MLSEVLSKSTCAQCKFCCSFRRKSLWETPLFDDASICKLSQENEYNITGCFENRQTQLDHLYKTADPEEEVPCTFLDPQNGCILKGEDKPFDCSIWPLRIMRKDGRLVIVLTPTCPAIGAVPNKKITALVKNGLGEKILDYAKGHPYIIKDYHEGFPIVQEF
ncbi:MAG: hypothetical protein MJY85_11230 [Fibrobacter sp.]|nr:hypothetical protein [Fibrobacter sp.]